MRPADYVCHKAFFSLTAAYVLKVSITNHLANNKSSLSYVFNHRLNFNVFSTTFLFMILPMRFEYFAQQDSKANTSFPFFYLPQDFCRCFPLKGLL